MSTLTIDAESVLGVPSPEYSYSVIQKPSAYSVSGEKLILDVVESGFLDKAGHATLELPDNEIGSWYDLCFQNGLENWVVPIIVFGDTTAADGYKRFLKERPDGGRPATIVDPDPSESTTLSSLQRITTLISDLDEKVRFDDTDNEWVRYPVSLDATYIATKFPRIQAFTQALQNKLASIQQGAQVNPFVPAKSSNADVDGETDDSDYMTVSKTYRAISRKVKNGSKTLRGLLQLSTISQADDGTDDTTAMTPKMVKRVIDAVPRISAFTQALQTKYDGYPASVDQKIEDARIDEFKDRAYIKLSNYNIVLSSTGSGGELLVSETTDNPPVPFVVIDVEDTANQNYKNILTMLQVGDEFLVHSTAGDHYILGTINAIAFLDDEGNTTSVVSDIVQARWNYTIDTDRGLDQWDDLPTGPAVIHLYPHAVDVGNAQGILEIAHGGTGVSSVSDLKELAQGSNETEDVGIFQRVAAGLASTGVNRFSISGNQIQFSVAKDDNYDEPTQNTNDAKFYRAVIERAWIRFGNGWEIRITSFTTRYISSNRAQYAIFYETIKGAAPGLNANTSVKIIGEDVHQGQLTDIAFEDIVALPSDTSRYVLDRAADGTFTWVKVPPSFTRITNIGYESGGGSSWTDVLTNLENTDTIEIGGVFTAGGDERIIAGVFQFQDVPTDRAWAPGFPDSGYRVQFRRNGTTLQAQSGGGSGHISNIRLLVRNLDES